MLNLLHHCGICCRAADLQQSMVVLRCKGVEVACYLYRYANDNSSVCEHPFHEKREVVCRAESGCLTCTTQQGQAQLRIKAFGAQVGCGSIRFTSTLQRRSCESTYRVHSFQSKGQPAELFGLLHCKLQCTRACEWVRLGYRPQITAERGC